MSTLLITGDTGLLGSAIAAQALRQFRVFGLSRTRSIASPGWTRRSVDLLNERVTSFLEEVQPTAIVHCAAATDVEQCENDPAWAQALNAGATERLAHWAAQDRVKFVYISTDSVFDGLCGRYREEDSPRPLNEYARSKAEGERVTLKCYPEALIVRTNFFGWNQGGKTSIGKWIYERLAHGEPLPAFSDVRFSPLFVEDLARIVLDLTARDAKGTFHVAARDSCSKYEFALLIGRVFRFDTRNVRSTLLEDALFRAKRPKDTSLCVAKCEEFLGRKMPSVQEGIGKFAEALTASRREQAAGGDEVERTIMVNTR